MRKDSPPDMDALSSPFIEDKRVNILCLCVFDTLTLVQLEQQYKKKNPSGRLNLGRTLAFGAEFCKEKNPDLSGFFWINLNLKINQNHSGKAMLVLFLWLQIVSVTTANGR